MSPEPAKPFTTPVLDPDVETRTRHAPRYRVVIHNDPVTTMDFVVMVLTSIFHLDQTGAIQVMMEAHASGCAHVVTLSLEEAEFRVDKAHSLARGRGFPLTLTIEPDE